MDRAPTLSITLQNFGSPPSGHRWDALIDQAVAAERAGIDRVVVVDHVLLGAGLDEYEGQRFPTDAHAPWLEPLTVLAAISARTSRIRIATGIILASLRGAAVLAKTAATLDVLSGGRLELGTGVGWQRAELAACGVPFNRRGQLLDTTLAVCTALWSGEEVTIEGDRGPLERVVCRPVPVQADGVPFWMGGRLTPPNLRRIVRHAHGWIPWVDYRNDLAAGVAVLRRALSAAGRDTETFGVRGHLRLVPGDVQATVAAAPAAIAAGATDCHVVMPLSGDVDRATEELAELVSAFRRAVGVPF